MTSRKLIRAPTASKESAPGFTRASGVPTIIRRMAQQCETARAYREPYSVQFSVFLSNRVGQLKDLLDRLGESDVRVLGVSVVDSTDWAVIRLVVSHPDRARQMLQERSMPFTESQVLLAELAEDGALAEICGMLLQAEINVHFAYPLTLRAEGNPVMVLHVDDPILSSQMLVRHGVRLLGNEDLTNPI